MVEVAILLGVAVVAVALALRGRALPAALLGVVVFVSACGAATEPRGETLTGAVLVARGAEVHANACATCHGEDLGGTEAGPSMLSPLYAPSQTPDEAMAEAITDGVAQKYWTFGPMTGVALPPGDVDAVIAYIRDEQERAQAGSGS